MKAANIIRKKNKKYDRRIYACLFPNCGEVFERYVTTGTGYAEAGNEGKHHNWLGMVQCPRCGNFLRNKEGV